LSIVSVSADSNWRLGDITVIDRFNDIHYWTIDPCIDQGIQTGEDINMKVYPISCAYVKNPSGLFGGYQYKLRCDNVAIKVSVYQSATHIYDTGWIDLRQPYICISVTNCNPYGRNFYFPAGTSFPTSYYGSYIKFGNSYNGDIWYFAYVPPFANETASGHVNITFNVNVSGQYTMKVYLKDTQNSSVAMATQLINFSVVGEDGVVSGQCNSTNSVGVQPVDNPVTDIFGNWKDLVWFVLMIIIGVVLFFVTGKNDIKIGIGVTIFVELIMLLIGAWLHIISPIYLLLFGIIICVAVTIAIRKVFLT